MSAVVEPPTAPSNDTEKYAELLSKFQRDINRSQDSDRNTRRRGLQKLIDDIPWTGKGGSGTKKATRTLLVKDILPIIIGIDLSDVENTAVTSFKTTGLGLVGDPIEKCRELSLVLLKKIFDNVSGLKRSVVCATVSVLTERLNGNPFPEVAEELRLQVVDNLLAGIAYVYAAHTKAIEKDAACVDSVDTTASGPNHNPSASTSPASFEESEHAKPMLENCINASSRALGDAFPAVKRQCAELICQLSKLAPIVTRRHYRKLCSGLALNCSHQHSKTRSISLQGLGGVLSLVTEGFDTALGTMENDTGLSMDKNSIMAIAASGSSDTASRSNTESGKAKKSLDLLLLFSKLVFDGNASVRKMLGIQLGVMLSSRFGRYSGPVNSSAEIEAAVLLLLLLGDEIDDVAACAMTSLEQCTALWTGKGIDDGIPDKFDANAHIVDGELALKQQQKSEESTPYDDQGEDTYHPRRFLESHAKRIAHYLLRGVADWTAVGQRRYLHGLNKFLLIGGSVAIEQVLPALLKSLGGPCRDDDPITRAAAEACCSRIGCMLSRNDAATIAIDALVPAVGGVVEGGGGNTASLRCNAARQLTHILKGLMFSVVATGKGIAGTKVVEKGAFLDSFPVPLHTVQLPLDQCNTSYAGSVIQTLLPAELYEFREPYFRESILLLVRSIMDTFLHIAVQDDLMERTLVSSLIYLQGKCPGETDLVPSAARAELERLANLAAAITNNIGIEEALVSSKDNMSSLFSRHFNVLLDNIYRESLEAQQLVADTPTDQIVWGADSVTKSAFDMLIRSAPAQAWACHEQILPVLVPQVKLPPIASQDTPDAHMETYKAQQGDTDAFADSKNVSTRLTLMALLESWVRTGALDWTCSAHISNAAPTLLKNILVGNLVWRVGRVESTVRKVTLAVTYSLLRAGAVKPATLYEVASELTPQIVSQMDDNETSVRHMAALCLCVVFERLKGAFGYQAISELYPMLIKRLDDSNDEVRIQSCKALGAFMAAASPGAYSGTALDYTLDQLFIHLDDSDPTIQAVVYDVIIIGSTLNKDLVWKKAHENLATHRNTKLCDQMIAYLRG
jgi:hypothetical protein